MSHFCVLVIGPNVEEQMAPYQENNMGDCPQEYLTFHDQEDEFRKEYEEDGCDMVRLEDGSFVYSWDERFRVPGTFATVGGNSHKVPAHLKEERVPHKSRFPTFEAFCADWHSSEERDPVMGRYGHWENPNAKWDYYRTGGRWAGFFKLKAGVEAAAPTPGYEASLGLQDQPTSGTADVLLKGEIDWVAMRDAAGDKAAKKYDFAMTVLGALPKNLSWEEVRADHELAHEASREAYWGQPRCVAWKDAEKTIVPPSTRWGFIHFMIAPTSFW